MGGTAAYSSLTALRQGHQAAWYTSFAPGLELPPELASLPGRVLPSPRTTTFENRYHPSGEREQHLWAVADPLPSARAPELQPDVLHLGPVAREVDPALASRYQATFVGVTPQGWLRRWGDGGRVRPLPWSEAAAAFPEGRWDALVLSEEDLAADPSAVGELRAHASVVVLTRGTRASLLLAQGREEEIPPWLARPVDPTGAGDVFSTILFLSLAGGAEPYEAARRAAAAASLAVEGVGLEGAPDRAALELRLQRGPHPAPAGRAR